MFYFSQKITVFIVGTKFSPIFLNPRFSVNISDDWALKQPKKVFRYKCILDPYVEIYVRILCSFVTYTYSPTYSTFIEV